MQVVSTRVRTGVGTHVHTIACALRDRGVEVVVTPLTDGPMLARSRKDGLRVRCPRHRFRGDARTFFRLAEIARQERVDILHTHGIVATFYAHLAARRLGPERLITTIHSVPEEATRDWQRWRWLRKPIIHLNRRLLARANHLICLTTEMREMMKQEGIPEEKLSLIPNTVDLSHCDVARGARDEIRQSVGIPRDAPVVGFVGRLAPAKDPLRFVELSRRLAAVAPRVRFLMVGDGPLMSRVEERVVRCGLQPKFNIVGWQDSAARWIAAMDVLVVPSRTETGPLVAYESMALENPVVGTPVGSLPELVQNEESGFLSWDDGELVDALHRYLSNPSQCQGMGKCARQHLLQYMKEQDAISRLRSIYETVLAESN